jgi:hypothetical protein
MAMALAGVGVQVLPDFDVLCGPGLAAAVCFDFALQYLGN